MNFLRKIYPLWLRGKLYFHWPARQRARPENFTEVSLEFAPVKLCALLNTDCGHRQIARLGFYELELSQRMAVLGRRGGLLVDVGANVGYFTTIWAGLNPQNEVYAFEPSPRNLAMLQKNVSGLLRPGGVKIFTEAVGKAAGVCHFDVGPEAQSGWGGLTTALSARTIPIKVRRLDDIIPVDKLVSVLKVDTEGADTWVLFGAENLLRHKRIQHIFFEANLERMAQLGIDADAAAGFLSDLDYQVSPLGGDEFYATPRP
jgi:FkbM family methyltransferase